ncbi:SPW repeat domain-containing protein [Vulgatibacter incomptus]|uniref:SPW repeat-containing integral membrane domain-containing protein n=1 Tax=Vulgatibacter incomptus TaxID=1391653 RepID=A0A0K1PAX8_9BACT|nr:SPW repeat protein [Vulgatibacter incomptus]AKU90693.1 hypothetical protein AKJ08_1080 [Vulgatibacter incomptus]
MSPIGARIANIVLGIWLFISAFIWPHGPAQLSNTWIIGIATVVVASIALAVPGAKYVNTALAIWLFISVWVLPGATSGTQWNNAVVAILIFLFSLVAEGRRHPGVLGHHRKVRPA